MTAPKPEGAPDPQAGTGQQDSSQNQSGEQSSSQGGTSGSETKELYNHPLLKGKTPEEIERLVGTMQDTVREQGRRLTAKQAEPAPAAPAGEPKTKADFFQKPEEAMRSIVQEEISGLRSEISESMKSMAPDPREALAKKFSDFGQVEPYIDQLLSKQDYPDPNHPGLLETLYYTAKGVMVHQGIVPTADESAGRMGESMDQHAAGQPASKPSGFVPPQHRASSPPPPPASEGEDKEPVLTENEKRLANEMGFNAKEYKAWQEMDAAEVPNTKLGKEEAK